MSVNVLKSVLHNIGIVCVGLAMAHLGTLLDSLLGISGSASPLAKGAALLLAGGNEAHRFRRRGIGT